jgi:hypothetical protein
VVALVNVLLVIVLFSLPLTRLRLYRRTLPRVTQSPNGDPTAQPAIELRLQLRIHPSMTLRTS